MRAAFRLLHKLNTQRPMILSSISQQSQQTTRYTGKKTLQKIVAFLLVQGVV